MPIRVVLADDHVLVRQSLRSFLEREGIQVVGEASDGQELIGVVARMPLMNGLEAAGEIHRASPDTKAILLTRHDEEQYVTEALRMGVKGYVLKNQAATDLVHAIHQVCRGGFYLSPGVSGAVAEALLSKTARPPDPLTSRERQVLQLISEGKSTKDVACLLGISAKTAESHRARLMHKLDIHETASLVRYAIRRGLVQP
jgi:DNA-binding NarL/FixJ family response regulator